MLTVRPSEDRGHTKTDWLSSRHTFSFGSYEDSKWNDYRALKVINEDLVAPKSGFDPHAHKDMEILTYVLSGELTHSDSEGNTGVLSAGSVQLMSAGTGIEHSEINDNEKDPVHFLQIWVAPTQNNLPPTYQQTKIPNTEKRNTLKIIAAPDGADGALKINQDMFIYTSLLAPAESITVAIESSRHVWIQVVSGSCFVNGEEIELGDGIVLAQEDKMEISATSNAADIILFDMS